MKNLISKSIVATFLLFTFSATTAAKSATPDPYGSNSPTRIAEQVARVVSSRVKDEDTMHPVVDEESGSEHPSWSGMEIPEPFRREITSKTTRKMRRAVRKAHRGLPHLSRQVFV